MRLAPRLAYRPAAFPVHSRRSQNNNIPVLQSARSSQRPQSITETFLTLMRLQISASNDIESVAGDTEVEEVRCHEGGDVCTPGSRRGGGKVDHVAKFCERVKQLKVVVGLEEGNGTAMQGLCAFSCCFDCCLDCCRDHPVIAASRSKGNHSACRLSRQVRAAGDHMKLSSLPASLACSSSSPASSLNRLARSFSISFSRFDQAMASAELSDE